MKCVSNISSDPPTGALGDRKRGLGHEGRSTGREGEDQGDYAHGGWSAI